MGLPPDTNNARPSARSPGSVQQQVAVSHGRTLATETGSADGFLFPPDDLICSVLDLTHELEKLGVIEIHRQPSGAEFYRIIDKLAKPSRARQPTGDTARRLGAIFRRKGSTLWNLEEIKAFGALTIDSDDLAVVEEYYKSESKKEQNYCRTSLLTFLRHYPGEVDRARRWKENMPRRHSY